MAGFPIDGHICDRIWEKGALRAKRDFLSSTYHHFKAVKALGFRLDLLAVWTFYFKNPEQASCPEQWATKEGHKAAIFECDRHSRLPRPYRKWAGSAIWSKCSRMMKEYSYQVWSHSCNSSRGISILKQKFGKCAKCPLFSNPVTYIHHNISISQIVHARIRC